MAEPTLFQADTLQVTRRRVVADGQEYALQDITSVEIGTVALPRPLLALALFLGVSALVISQSTGSIVWSGVALLVLVATGVLWWRANRTKILVIGTREGNKQVYTSTDRQLIERAAGTIDALLVQRGRR